jgi:hypothetical protein
MCDLFIYEEEIHFYETELSLERCSYEIDLICDLLYCESSDDKSDDNKFKTFINNIIKAFKTFFDKCRKYNKESVDKLTDRIGDALKTHKIDLILKDFDNALDNAQKAGLKSFEYMDINALKKLFKDEAYDLEKEINKFTKAYIAKCKPKDAENMVKNIKEIGQSYSKRIADVKSKKKKYSISSAKKISEEIAELKNANSEFAQIINRYQTVCDDTEKLVVNTLESLDKYSAESGYVQNAKSLKDVVHNSLLGIRSHATDITTSIVSTWIPIMLDISRYGPEVPKIAKTVKDRYKETIKRAKEDAISGNKDQRSVSERFKDDYKKDMDNIKKQDENTKPSKTDTVAGVVSDVLRYGGNIPNAALKSIRKVSRTNDIKKWKDSKSSGSLSFDKRDLTADEIKDVKKKAIATGAIDTTIDAAAETVIKKIFKK